MPIVDLLERDQVRLLGADHLGDALEPAERALDVEGEHPERPDPRGARERRRLGARGGSVGVEAQAVTARAAAASRVRCMRGRAVYGHRRGGRQRPTRAPGAPARSPRKGGPRDVLAGQGTRSQRAPRRCHGGAKVDEGPGEASGKGREANRGAEAGAGEAGGRGERRRRSRPAVARAKRDRGSRAPARLRGGRARAHRAGRGAPGVQARPEREARRARLRRGERSATSSRASTG